MALPKKKITRSRAGKRRSHQALTAVPAVVCDNPNCEPDRSGLPRFRMAHHACPHCGAYRGRSYTAENRS